MDTTNIARAPETLLEAVAYFRDETTAADHFARLRWPDGKQGCPKCGVLDAHYFLASRRVWKCRACRRQFSVKVGTIFQDSPLPLSKWLPAMWMLANCKNGISSYELSRALGVSQKSTWFMLHRLRLALQPDGGGKLRGTVEVDDTGIGGLARNTHKDKRKRVIKGRGLMSMTNVMGLLERGSKDRASRVRLMVTRFGLSAAEAGTEVRKHVEAGATVNTDAATAFRELADTYAHGVVNHGGGEWARGSTHTNSIENFWALLKRTVKGTYTNIAPFHTFRYLDEQAFRFNERRGSDLDRFQTAMRSVESRRLTYANLTGASQDRRSA